MKMKVSSLGRFPKLIRRLRPTNEEVERYARMIMQHERKPLSALAACQREAEIQLWAMRSLFEGDPDQIDRSHYASG